MPRDVLFSNERARDRDDDVRRDLHGAERAADDGNSHASCERGGGPCDACGAIVERDERGRHGFQKSERLALPCLALPCLALPCDR